MKLYVYEHCPFCARVMMLLNFKNIPAEIIILQNDDEETPISMTGKKLVPILAKDDGTFLGESFDIVHYLDQNFGTPILAAKVSEPIQTWYDRVFKYFRQLAMPRYIQQNFVEFGSQSAIDYFINSKTPNIGDFAENVAKTDEYIAELNKDLLELDKMLDADKDQISLDDILLFPMLRNLSMVDEVKYPANVTKYLHRIIDLTKIDLFKQI